MNCDEFRAVVHEAFRDGPAAGRREEVLAHAADCPECGPYLKRCTELTCRDFVEFLNEYIDDELPAERKSVFERHIAACPDCENYIDAYRRTMELSAEALGAALPSRLPEDLVKAILSARRSGPRR